MKSVGTGSTQTLHTYYLPLAINAHSEWTYATFIVTCINMFCQTTKSQGKKNEWMTITNPFGLHHYHFRLQPNPIFPLQIQFPSIAPYISGCSCWWPHFLHKKLKYYCQCIIGKLHFQFSTHVLQGKKETQGKGKKCKWMHCYQLYITLVTLPYFISLVVCFRGKKILRCHSSKFFYHFTEY